MTSEPPVEPFLFRYEHGVGATRRHLTDVRVSPGLEAWLRRGGFSLALTTYRPGFLFLIGTAPEAGFAFAAADFHEATGLALAPSGLFVAAKFQIWRLGQALDFGRRAHEAVDAAFAPREAHVVGGADIQELAVDRDGRVVFVSARHACLATIDDLAGFRPLWRLPVASSASNRLRLTGLAMQDGVPRYVTVFGGGMADGVLIDTATGRIVAEGLAAPHSPRVRRDAVWLLESGRGRLVRIDPQSGAKQDIAALPGFARGLAFHGEDALVTLSRQHPDPALGQALNDALRAEGFEPHCGVAVIDTARGTLADWLSFEGGQLASMFDVAVPEGVACPTVLAGRDPNTQGPVTVDEEFGPLDHGDASVGFIRAET